MAELVLDYREQKEERQYPFGVKLLLLYILNVADWFCTQVLIDSGHFREINPMMAWIMEYPIVGFFVKCVLPLSLIIFIWLFYKIFKLEQNKFTNFVVYTGVIIYSVVIFIHIINFVLLFGTI